MADTVITVVLLIIGWVIGLLTSLVFGAVSERRSLRRREKEADRG